MITEHETDVAGTKIHWLDAGTGDEPFLLIHGFGSSVAKWLDVLPLLAEERRTIALDLPGFGVSDAPRGPYSPAWLAGGVLAFCDAIGVSRAIWTGNSLGGLVAIHAAAARPERVVGLIGVDAALPTQSAGRPSASVLLAFVAPALPVWASRSTSATLRARPKRSFAKAWSAIAPIRLGSPRRRSQRSSTTRGTGSVVRIMRARWCARTVR